MPSLKKITYAGLLLFLLRPLTLPAQNNEAVRLPERVIIGEDKAPVTVFSFRNETLPDTSLSSKTISPMLPSLSFSNLTATVGNQDNIGVSFFRQNDIWSLGVAANQQEIKPFPETVKELSLSVSRKKMVRAGILEFSFAVAGLWDLPASRKSGTRFIPAAISESREAKISLATAFGPDRPLGARFSIDYRLLEGNDRNGLDAIWPRWSAEAGITAKVNPKTGLTFFLDCPFDYNNRAVKIDGMCLPGVSLNYQWLPNNVITVTVKNLTGRQYEILPGYSGPGTTAIFGYSHSF